MMKRVWIGVAAAIVLLVGVVVIRTIMIAGPAAETAAVTETPASPVDTNLIARHLAQAIKFETVSYGDSIKENEKVMALRALQEWMELTYPYFHAAAGPEVINESLLFTWHGTNPNLLPVLVLAHMDVVPVTPGTEKDWTHAPFSGDIADGYVWGRGALDSKGPMIAMLEAGEYLARSGFQPDRTIMFAFGEDQELGGAKGGAAIAKALTERGTRFQWALDEGSSIMNEPYPGLHRPVAFVGTAEKGLLSLELVAHGEGGLAAQRLADAMSKIANERFDSDIDSVQRAKFDVLMPMLPMSDRAMLANLWLTKPLLMRRLQAVPELASVLRTTVSPAVANEEAQEDTAAQTATGVVNFRLHQRDTVASVTRRVRETIDDEQVDVIERDEPRAEPSGIVAVDHPAYVHLSDMIKVEFGVPTAPELMNYATDSRYYLGIADAVLRFRPFRAEFTDLPRVHGTDERVAIADLGKAAGFYMRLIQDLK